MSNRQDEWLLSLSQTYEMTVLSSQNNLLQATGIYILAYNNIYGNFHESTLGFIEYSFPIINIIIVAIYMIDGIFYSLCASYYKFKGLQYIKYHTNDNYMTIRDCKLQILNPQIILSINQGVNMILLWSFELLSVTRVSVQEIIPPVGFICIILPLIIIFITILRIYLRI